MIDSPLEQAVVENLHRVVLHALEEAAAYQQLIDEFDLTHDQVAQRVGKSRTYVTNTYTTLATRGRGAERPRLVADHRRSRPERFWPSAIPTHRRPSWAKVIKNEFSVRATEEAVKAFLEPRSITPAEATTKVPDGAPRLRPVPDASVAELEELLERYLDTRVHVDFEGS